MKSFIQAVAVAALLELRNIGSDLGFAVKGFKQGVKEAESLADLEPKLESQSTSRSATVEADTKEAVRRADDLR